MSTLKQIKTQAAVDALLANGLNQSKAAKQLGVSRGGLRALLSEYTGTTNGLSASVLKEYMESTQ